MNMDFEKTLADEGTSKTEIKKSKFYGLAYPVSSRERVNEILDRVRKQFADSTHIVYAYRIGIGGADEYFTDAGEPSGTAGAQIIRILKGRSISNAIIIVVRYFGGIKLGMGGLARAYGDAARLAIENAVTIPLVKMLVVHAIIPYGAVSKWAIFVDSHNGTLLSQKFGKEVEIEASLPESAIAEAGELIMEITHGKRELEIVKTN